jgi:hypothetical protein
MLGIIIFLAGQMGGGNFNFNVRGDKSDFDNIINNLRQPGHSITETQEPLKETSADTSIQTTDPKPQAANNVVSFWPKIKSKLRPILKNPKTLGLLSLLIIPLLLLIGLITVLWTWIRANFSFVFIDAVVRNDASLRIPFHRNKTQGNSFFWWSIAYGLAALITFGIIISLLILQLSKAGVFNAKFPINAVQILSIVLQYVPLLIVTGILFAVVSIFVYDFILPIMYKRKMGILKAWGVFFGIAKRNIGDILLYLLVKLGLSILAVIIAIVLVIVGILAFLLIGGLIGLLGWGIYSLTPRVAKPIVLGVLIVLGVPTFVFLGFLYSLIFIPITIFFRTFPLNVLGSIDESLDVFAAKSTEEVMLEADDEKYKKSMSPVWFTVLVAPVLLIIVALVAAVAIPNIVRGRRSRLRIDQFDFKKGMSVPSIPDFSIKDKARGEDVTVYLKNGSSFEAEIIKESEHNVAFQVEGGTFILPRSDILRIDRERQITD